MQQTVGRYRILRPLGRGAMGLVFLAEDPSLNRQVAIKMLDIEADSEHDREFLRTRLLRDARAAAILSHPNIVGIYDIVEEGQSVYVVMEYIEGESLASFLDHTPTPDHAFTIQVLRKVAAGLDYTHSKGIIHRDIKPGNIMIAPGGIVKILDFGIARMSDTRTCTPTGVIMGTVDYMAPEQIKAAMIDGRADQFSLAAVAYRMMSGSTLFGRHTLATLAYKLVNEAPQPVCQRNAAVPPAVDLVLSKALAKSPAERYPTCSTFVEELGHALFGTTPTLAAAATPCSNITVRTPTADLATPGKRSRTAALVAGGVLLAGGAGAIAVWKPWSRPTHQPVRSPAHVASAVVNQTEKPPVAKPLEPPAGRSDTPVTAQVPPPKQQERPVAKPQHPPVKPPDTTPPPKLQERPVITPQPLPVKPPDTPPVRTVPPPNSPPPPPETQETPFRRGLEEVKAKNYPAAIRSFTEVQGRHPKMAPAFYNRGFAYQMSNNLEKAVQDYSEAIRLGSRDPRAYANRGICEVKMHQDDLAFADFNHALELDPGYAGALNGRGGVLYRRKQYKPAIRDFTAAINANPEFVPAYENRAKARKEVGDPFGAADDLTVVRRLQRNK